MAPSLTSLGGVIAPVVTPFDAERDEILADAFRANLRAHLAQGLAGVLVTGSTGEAALLDDAERRQLVEWARAVVPDDRWLLVGVGSESTRQTVARARDAAERGADAVLVVAPHYYGPAMTTDALAAHYRRVADASPVPVLLYNIPKYMHFALEPELVHALAAHGNIVGIKDSAGDLERLGGYLEAQSARFTVLTGHAGTVYAALEMGAKGGILAVSLFAGALTLELWSAFVAGDYARAGRAQDRLRPLGKEIVADLGVAGIKCAMDFIGLQGGAPRPPLLPVREDGRRRIAALLQGAGVARAA
jgi:4-hydroxy-2-oxoglutarate aldolase